MPNALPRYALESFTHFDRHVKAGDELDLHDELVELRPDLFTKTPPPTKKPKKPKPSKE